MLTESQYLELCAACDGVLMEPPIDYARVAIPWLHVIREHPVFLEQYAGVFGNAPSRGTLLAGTTDVVRTLAGIGRMMVRGHPASAASGPLDVVFVSHLLNQRDAGREADFYFSDWPKRLADRGLRVAVVLISHTRTDRLGRTNPWMESPVPRFILRPVMSARDEWRIVRATTAEARRLRARARREQDRLHRRVLAAAAGLATDGTTRATMRIGLQLEEFLRRHQPGAMIVTHEGHAWERLAFAAARVVSPRTRCIGYQHALLFRRQHAILRPLAPSYDPDVILTSGETARRRLAAEPRLAGSQVDRLGSTRALSNGNSQRLSDRARSAGSGRACVVLPEGLIDECRILFDLSLECARLVPEVRFIWRLHPVLPWSEVARRNAQYTTLPPNVVLSEATLDADLAASDWALYRGTTAIIRAAAEGVMPVYARRPGEMTVDPFYEAGDRVPSVESGVELAAALRDPYSAVNRMSAEDAAVLQRLSQDLFTPVDLTALLRHLPAHG